MSTLLRVKRLLAAMKAVADERAPHYDALYGHACEGRDRREEINLEQPARDWRFIAETLREMQSRIEWLDDKETAG